MRGREQAGGTKRVGAWRIDGERMMGVLGWVYGFAKKTAIGAAGIGAGLLVLLIAFQEKLIYVPAAPGCPRDYEFDPSRLSMEFEDVWIEAMDGVRLHCWFIKHREGAGRSVAGSKAPTVLWFQENAGNMAYRLLFIKPLVNLLG